MGPHVKPKWPWEPEVISQAPISTPPTRNYSDEMAVRIEERWNSGFCPCNCGMELERLRAAVPHLYLTYEQTGIWTGPIDLA